MITLLGFLHALGWSIYVGGALIMELVLRHAQNDMHPSQVAVVCQWTGRRYRWWSLSALSLLAVTGVLLAANRGWPLAAGSYNRTVWLLAALWFFQLSVLGALGLGAHPAMHARAAVTMSGEELREERQRVRAAIRRMDRLLRLELAGALLALLIGVSLHQEGIL